MNSIVYQATHCGGFLFWRIPLQNKHLKAFKSQKAGAAARGIGWELTFEEWLSFWGNDIDRRGSGRNSLQMQRFADTGPYALGNIRKGVPAQNSATYSAMSQNRKAVRAAREHQKRLDAMMFAPSAPAYEDDPAEDENVTGNIYGNRLQSSFPRAWQFAPMDGKGHA